VGEEKCIKGFDEKSEEKASLISNGCRWKHVIKTDLKVIEREIWTE
jgi:hypothetical protein